METVGMENLSSAAAQGEQAFDPHHANGYNFTGAGPNVQTLEDTARHERFVIAHVRLPLGTSLYCIISCSCWSWLVALALRFCVDVREFPARILGR